MVEPTHHDVEHIAPKTGTWNTRLLNWIQGRWSPDRDDVINNDKINKLSAYYFFGNYSM